jgi:hypothetical protein
LSGDASHFVTPARLAEMCRKKALADEAVRQARVLLYQLANEPEIVRHLATGHPTGSIGAVEAAKTRLECDMRAQIQRLAVACRQGSLASAQTEWSEADQADQADQADASASASNAASARADTKKHFFGGRGLLFVILFFILFNFIYFLGFFFLII